MILSFLSVWDTWVAHSRNDCGNGNEEGSVWSVTFESLLVGQVPV